MRGGDGDRRRRRPAAVGLRLDGGAAQAEKIGFVAGSNWDERLAGTNAPAGARHRAPVDHHAGRALPQQRTALELRRDADPRPVDRAGHRRPRRHRGDQVAVPQTMAMVRTAARLAEAELARERIVPRATARPGTGLLVHVEGWAARTHW